MLAWFPFPFQLVNKLNLRLPQIAVKDEKEKAFPFHSCWKHFHTRCESHVMQKQTQGLRPLCPKQLSKRRSQIARAQDRRTVSTLPAENQPFFLIFPLVKNMARYLESLTYTRHSSHTGEGTRKEKQSEKAGDPLIWWAQRTSLTRRHGEKLLPVQWEEQLDPTDPSSLFCSVLTFCRWSATEILRQIHLLEL